MVRAFSLVLTFIRPLASINIHRTGQRPDEKIDPGQEPRAIYFVLLRRT